MPGQENSASTDQKDILSSITRANASTIRSAISNRRMSDKRSLSLPSLDLEGPRMFC